MPDTLFGDHRQVQAKGHFLGHAGHSKRSRDFSMWGPCPSGVPNHQGDIFGCPPWASPWTRLHFLLACIHHCIPVPHSPSTYPLSVEQLAQMTGYSGALWAQAATHINESTRHISGHDQEKFCVCPFNKYVETPSRQMWPVSVVETSVLCGTQEDSLGQVLYLQGVLF